jgi:hypothetical protein
MARTVLAPLAASAAGTTVTLTAAPNGDGDAVPPGSILWLNNASGGSITVTFITGGTADSLSVADPTATVAAGVTKMFLIPGGVYPQTSGTTKDLVHVDYSAFASLNRVCLAGNH